VSQSESGNAEPPDREGGDGAERPGAPVRPRHRLDPDRAAAAARRAGRRPPPPVIDTRRYQRMIGLIGLTLVVVISVAFLTSHTPGTAGVPAGNKLPFFSAPLATSNLNGVANLKPPCTLARHDPRALNICLMAKRGPLVLAFFVTSSGGCVAQVSALQTLSIRFPRLQFAAVAVRASHSDAASTVRAHHWTIPVAYDADGAVGDSYGVEVCPIVELARRGGRVEQRLIGERWNDPAVLSGPVRHLLAVSSRP
jgi:peroxiredoxin